MTPERRAWERAARVQAAARGWRRAGAIDEATLAAIREAFPDPCLRPGPVWRALTGCVVGAIGLCVFAAFALASGGAALRVGLLVFAAAALVLTELVDRSPRHARRGVAGATAALGLGFLLAGTGLVLLDTSRMPIDQALDVLLAVSVLAGIACALWWGGPAFAGLSAVSLFLLLGRLPHGRLSWLVVGLALAGAAARRIDDGSWAPSHRAGAAVVLVAGLGAAYAAVNLYSLDARVLEHWFAGTLAFARAVAHPGPWPPALRLLSALATMASPVALLGWGARSRRPLLLDAGIVLLALSLATLRHSLHLAPLWMMLGLSGVLLAGLALAAERVLRRAPGGEIGGFTAEPLFTDERGQAALQAVPVVAAFTPAGAPPAPETGELAGEGRFGGGGASEKF